VAIFTMDQKKEKRVCGAQADAIFQKILNFMTKSNDFAA
jgi:hypothetical protein